MESSWRQLTALVGYGESHMVLCAKLLTPIAGFTHVSKWVTGSIVQRALTFVDTQGYAVNAFHERPDFEGNFPYGKEVYPDDFLPPPWP